MDSQLTMDHYLTDWTTSLNYGGSKGEPPLSRRRLRTYARVVELKVGVSNRVNAAAFKYPRIARFFYPILRAGRNLLLRMLGRTPLHLA
jgi:hypothetical protein